MKIFTFNSELLGELFEAFPNAIINHLCEFVADPNPRVNSYFSLDRCLTHDDVAIRIIHWLSREAGTSLHYSLNKYNAKVWQYHLDGINRYIGKSFTLDDMEIIYASLGNAVYPSLTRRFIASGYDMKVLWEEKT